MENLLLCYRYRFLEFFRAARSVSGQMPGDRSTAFMYIILTIPSMERGPIPLYYVTIRGRLARERIISLPRLTLLVHNWPTPPAHIRQIYPRWPEGEILHALNLSFSAADITTRQHDGPSVRRPPPNNLKITHNSKNKPQAGKDPLTN